MPAEWVSEQRAQAQRLGVTRRTIEGWVRRPAFKVALEARYEQIRAENDAF